MGNESSSPTKSKNESGIVVVARPDSQQKDSSQAELQYCPTFQPLLTTSLNIPESRPLLSELVKQIDDKSCLKLCIHLQSHLEDCSGAAKFDQIPLISKVKEVDKVSSIVLQRLIERQRTFAKYADQTKKVEEISKNLSSLQKHMDKAITLANELNSLLPNDLKLEPLQL